MIRTTARVRAAFLVRPAAAVAAALAAAGAGCRDITSPAQDPTTATYAPALRTNFGLDITKFTRDTSGVYYRDLVPGTGAPAVKGSTVSYYFTGYLADGRQFNTNTNQTSPSSLVIGSFGGIPRIDRGMVGMATNGRRVVILPPALGYGNQSVPNRVPAGSVLIYVLDTPGVAAPATTTTSRAPR
jgi:peptidylprolyl isomerase